MRLEPAGALEIHYVAKNMRGDSFAEFSALYPVESRRELAGTLMVKYDRPGVYAAFIDDYPVVIGAFLDARPGVTTTLFFATDRFPQVARPLSKAVRFQVFPALQAGGIYRVETMSLVGNAATHRWLTWIGLQPEGEPVRRGLHGEYFQLFSQALV